MFNYGYGQYDPYQQRLQTMQQANLPRYEIVHVNGENGANAFRMAPNSNCLLLDDTAPIIWLCQSDGAGYHTVTPYKIVPYEPEPIPDYRGLEDRIKKLEEKLNGQSDVTET